MRRAFILLALATAVAAPVIAQMPTSPPGKADVSLVKAGTYKVDSAHTQIAWKVDHLGFSTYYGLFGDATGPAMFAIGVHEAVRRGWLPGTYASAAESAWTFVKANLTDDGVLRNTYYVWALPAENREMRLRDESAGWAMGFVLAAANEMTL